MGIHIDKVYSKEKREKLRDLVLNKKIGELESKSLTLSNNVLVFPVPGGPTTLYLINSYLLFFLLVCILSYRRVAVLLYILSQPYPLPLMNN